MDVSVVVPTRDRPAALLRCLAALAAQDGGLEIVVVDDASRDRAALAEAIHASGAQVRVVRGPGRGPATARNLGWRAAQCAVLCFTDDDCIAEPGWAARLAEAAAASLLAAGRTVPESAAPAAVVASQAITEHLQLSSLDPSTGRLRFAPSSNLAATRDALADLPFDESFPTAAGEDRDFAARAWAAGHGALYVPEAVVVHRPELDARAFIRQQYRYGRGAVRFRASGPERGLPAPRWYGELVRRGFADGVKVGALVVAAQAAVASGALAERLGRGRASARSRSA
jgi:glycosyltransferase involved in cell wall biosynthesis